MSIPPTWRHGFTVSSCNDIDHCTRLRSQNAPRIDVTTFLHYVMKRPSAKDR